MANPKELQKFLDVWGPVVASLPAIINATEREEEQQRHIGILEARMEEVKSETARLLAVREAGLMTAQAALDATQAEYATVSDELRVAKAAVKAEVSSVRKETDAKIKQHEERLATVQAQLAVADAELAGRLAQQEEVFTARATNLQAAIDELESTRLKAESALAELRFKLG